MSGCEAPLFCQYTSKSASVYSVAQGLIISLFQSPSGVLSVLSTKDDLHIIIQSKPEQILFHLVSCLPYLRGLEDGL